tara:strand:- start:1180 stop:2403 length:1224 start_codon:yes stop_codon:yes gene_type:complete
MIVVCEPTCLSFSHEKINEGFLYVINKLHPSDDILFLAHNSHYEILKKSLKKNDVDISRIKFENIKITTNSSLSLIYTLLLINKLKRLSAKKIFFFSTPKFLLFCLKYIISIDVKKYFVLHSELEELKDLVEIEEEYYDVPKDIYTKIKRLNLSTIQKKLSHLFNYFDPIKYILSKHSFNKLILDKKDDNYNFIVISKHIIINLKNKLEMASCNLDFIHYPQLTYKIDKVFNNNYPKFAIFGYGDSKMHYNLNLLLKELNIQLPFEIRIIGMDNRATSSFPWITFPSNGKTLSRTEMEALLKDIDFNLILYTKDRYSLSCSASIIEAISYEQPIIHLENPCISYYNKNESIGYKCTNLLSMAKKIEEIVLNYNQELNNIKRFKINLAASRNSLSPDNNLKRFSKVFN